LRSTASTQDSCFRGCEIGCGLQSAPVLEKE
jgi:hypothetical protein